MLRLDELLATLEYTNSPYYRTKETDFEPETVHLFRNARNVGVDGIYVFETSPGQEDKVLPPQPAVYVSSARDEEEASRIHRSLWNLYYTPFLIVRLPQQIRIYTGFSYSPTSTKKGLLENIDSRERLSLLKKLAATAIDTGALWSSDYGKKLNPSDRVDKQLLKNLQQLSNALQEDGLQAELAHALIGKYVYMSYLRDRNILSDEWLAQHNISPQEVFTLQASVANLRRLDEAIEDRFNGQIFPIDFGEGLSLRNEHVSWVASVFGGAEFIEGTPEPVRQLHLPFKAYDFRYIPVETLSTIYEQFIQEKKRKGAIYTPEVLADYLLSEMEWAMPLKMGMRVLDPACGSGVFLVIVYRRLIEKEMVALDRKLHPEELRRILLESIFGIERELDACYITEFSLILTLLHYVEPGELDKDPNFQFPSLHNYRIYHYDFFDPRCPLWQKNFLFDWIVGNPPWVKAGKKDQLHANNWILEHKKDRPVGDKNVATAFSWHIGDYLKTDGLAGLVLPATSLVNLRSRQYRKEFFSRHTVLRVTNFANMRRVLFDKRSTLPATTMIYRKSGASETFPPILHYGPFSINQVAGRKSPSWVITINDGEIQTVDPSDALSGKTYIWKLALWGTPRDKRALERLQYLYPNTLEEFCKQKHWGSHLPRQGAELNKDSSNPSAEIKGYRHFDTKMFNKFKPRHRFSIPDNRVLQEITEDFYIRRGKDTLQLTTPAPHVIFSTGWQNFAIYSDVPFVVPPRQLVIAAPEEPPENRDYLKALTVYLSSSIVAYFLFFHVPEWGIFRQRRSVVTSEVRKIPTPSFSPRHAKELSRVHRELVKTEQEEITGFLSEPHSSPEMQYRTEGDRGGSGALYAGSLTKRKKQALGEFSQDLQTRLQTTVDQAVNEILEIPSDIRILAEEFTQLRLKLDKPSAWDRVTKKPEKDDLATYATELRDELDSFTLDRTHHRVTISSSSDLIECSVEVTREPTTIPIDNRSIENGQATVAKLFTQLSDSLKQQVAQWVYVQRSLFLFDGPRIYIYKSPRRIDWTRTQALNDANSLIAPVLRAEKA